MAAFLTEDQNRARQILETVQNCPGVESAGLLSLQGCRISKEERPVPRAPDSSSTEKAAASQRELQGFLVVPESVSDFGRFIALQDGDRALNLGMNWGTGLQGDLHGSQPESGAILTRKASILLGIRAGDRIVVDIAGRKAKIRVAAITDQYVMHFVYLSPQSYQRLFGRSPVYNQIAITEQKTAQTAGISATQTGNRPSREQRTVPQSREEKRRQQRTFEDQL